jgi:outer membrane protein assembly factor BamD
VNFSKYDLLARGRAIFAFSAITILSACSSTNVKNSEDPEVIYNEIVTLIEKDRFIEAGELVGEIRRRFPQSRFAALAELRNGDIFFKQDSYTEAAAAYGVFVELYPKHADAPYAQYQRTLSYFNDAPENIARDQGPARDAVIAAETLAARYPQSDFAAKAAEIRKKARLRLAEKEAYVARFYEKRGAKEAAKTRWQGLLVSFPDLKELPEAANLLKEAEKNSVN